MSHAPRQIGKRMPSDSEVECEARIAALRSHLQGAHVLRDRGATGMLTELLTLEEARLERMRGRPWIGR